MKILHVFDSFSPSRGGGTVTLLYKLAKSQAQRGHEITIYTTDFELDQKYIDSIPEVTVVPFHCISTLGTFFITPSIIQVARENLKQFDVIHIHAVRSFQNIIICNYARKYGIPYIIDQHGSLPRTHGKRTAKAALRWLFDLLFGYRILRGGSKAIAQNNYAVEEYKEYKIAGDKIALIPLFFPIEDYDDLPPYGEFRKAHSIQSEKLITYIGRINMIKGIDFLISGFYEILKHRRDIVLVIIGSDDGHKAHLVEQIKKLGISDKVIFTGFLGGNDKLSALLDADVVVQPSRYEQAAWAPIEAILCETPVIVTKDSGSGEDVRRIGGGYAVSFGNTLELAETIENILSGPQKSQEMVQTAKQYVMKNLSLNASVSRYDDLYGQCLSKSKQMGDEYESLSNRRRRFYWQPLVRQVDSRRK